MPKPEALTVRLRIVYDGTPPNTWDGGARDVGLQDKANALLPGAAQPDGGVIYEVSLEAKRERAGAPVFLGDFAHGPPKERFLYLSWRNASGAYAQRLKLPLAGIAWSDLEAARGGLLIGRVAPASKPRKPGGVNVGGARAVQWRRGD